MHVLMTRVLERGDVTGRLLHHAPAAAADDGVLLDYAVGESRGEIVHVNLDSGLDRRSFSFLLFADELTREIGRGREGAADGGVEDGVDCDYGEDGDGCSLEDGGFARHLLEGLLGFFCR